MEPTAKSPQAIRVAAHEWHARIEAGDMTRDDRRRFARWLAADPRHSAAYERAASLWADVSALDRAAVPAAAFRPLLRERFVAWRRAGWGPWSLRIASGSLALAAVVFVMLQVIPFGFFDPGTEHFETAVAEIRAVTLPDGSVVTLGAKTHLSVAMDPQARKVELHGGEAFFDVARDPARPFTVRADETDVTVLGTAFDLREVERSLRIAVAEGLVAVWPATSEAEGPQAELTAGQQVSVSEEGAIGPITAVAPDTLGAWRRNRLVYVGASLSEVVADANRYHDGWIVLRDQGAANLKITGAFDATDIDGMLATLDDALPITLWRPLDVVTFVGSAAPAAAN